MKEKTVCFTGHREIPSQEFDELSRRLERILIQLIEDGNMYFGTGGALGFDTLAAQTVLKLKMVYPCIKLILVLPCQNQAEFWKQEDRTVYENIIANSDKVVYTSKIYFRGCM